MDSYPYLLFFFAPLVYLSSTDSRGSTQGGEK